MRYNGGTRTFAEPEGDPYHRTDDEEKGNIVANFMGELFLILLEA